MNAARMVMFVLGLALILVGAWMLFYQTGLAQWIPLSVAGAGLLVLIGLLVVGFSESGSDHDTEVIEEHHHH